MAEVDGLAPGEGGTTGWLAAVPLTNHGTYYWRANATDSNGAQTQTPARMMIVNTGKRMLSEIYASSRAEPPSS